MTFCSTPAPSSSCSALKTFFKDRGLQHSVVPSSPSLGNTLKVCTVNRTCCTLKVEQNFKGLAQKDFDGELTNNIDPTKVYFDTQGKKFDDYFKKVIKKSQTDLNDMFTKTYGILYKQNSKVFMDLFAEFSKYFAGRNLDLGKVVDEFFAYLLRKMFELLNPELSFTSKYLECVTEFKDDLKPFGELPHKLPRNIKKVFVEARAFVEGLNVGRDVLSEMAGITASESCQAGMAKMKYCSLCSGYGIVKPCKDFCHNVFKGCFLGWEYLNPHWDNYIAALEDLSQMLEGFETIVDHIDVSISDAIMNMQDNSLDIKQKVFSGCGSPGGKTKRSVASSSDFFIDSPKKRNRREISKDAAQGAQPTAPGASLERMVKALKTKVKGTKGMWSTMSQSVCSTVAAPAKTECWNGTAKIIPDVSAVPNNRVMSNDSHDQMPAIISRQISQLKLIVHKLKSARNGEDVILEGEDDNDVVSGSGSGSASGNEIPTDSSRTLSPTEGNSVEDNVLGGGLEKDALDARNSAFSIQPSAWLVLPSLYLILRVIAV